MNFANPLAWVGLLSIPVILLMYLLKQKYTALTVPSLFLWQKALNMSKAQRPWQKLRRNLLMFLQILLAFFLVCALANPYFSTTAAVDASILVLDNTLSMQATDASPSRHEKAKADMIAMVASAAPGARFTVVTANASPAIIVNDSDDKRLVTDRIRAIAPGYTAMDMGVVQSLVRMLANDGSAAVFFFSDKEAGFDDIHAQHVRIGESADNMAITRISHSIDGDRVVLLVKVKNFGANTVDNGVAVYYDGIFHDVREVSLEPGEEQDVFFTSIPYTADVRAHHLEARLTRADVLPADDVAYSVVSEAPVKPVMLMTEQNLFLESMLNLLPNVALYRTAPEHMAGLSGYYVYVFDGVLPEQWPEDGHLLIFNPPTDNALVETAGQTAISALSAADNALFRLIGDLDFAISRSKTLTPPDWAETLLWSNETPLILAGEQGSQKIVVMGFSLHDTDLPLRKEFPIFMYNLMQHFIPQNIISGSQLVAGGMVTVNAAPDVRRISIATPQDEMVVLAPPFPVAPFNGMDAPGFYTLVQEMDGGAQYDSFAVNVPEGESNLLRGAASDSGGAVLGASAVRRNAAGILLAVVLILLLTEWWVFGRGR